MKHEEYKELLDPAALDALAEADSRALQRHLLTCAECRTELEELRDTTDMLSYLTAPVTPPADLYARILADIHARRTQRTSEADRRGDGYEAMRADESSSALSSDVASSLLSQRKRSIASLTGAVAMAGVFVVLVVAVIALWNRNRELGAEQTQLSRRNEELEAELNRLTQRNTELQTELSRPSNRNQETPTQIDSLPNRNNTQPGPTPDQRAAAAPSVNQPPVTEPSLTPEAEARVVELTGTDKAPQARARLIYNSRTGGINLTVSDLPSPPVGKIYQLWYVSDGRPIPGSMFSTGKEGRAMLRGQIPVAARNASIFIITLEKSGGATKPSAKYLLGTLS